jgi:hypothetical protein
MDMAGWGGLTEHPFFHVNEPKNRVAWRGKKTLVIYTDLDYHSTELSVCLNSMLTANKRK